MALVFLDGFDHYATAQLQAKWPSQGLGPSSLYSIRQGGGREAGGGALYAATNGSGDNNQPLVSPVFSSQSTWVVGGAVLANPGCTPFNIGDSASGAIQLTVGVNGSGYAYGVVEAGTYTATTVPVSGSAWFYLEAQIVISATVGSLTVRVNGTTVVTETNINTAKGGVTTANCLIIGAPGFSQGTVWTVNGLIDDLYLFDGAGSANTTFPSAIPTVQCLWPNAPGTNAQWTGLPYASGNNFANVNDETPDGDFTVNQSGTVGNLDTFKHDELRPPSGTVFALQHCITARTSTATSHSVAAAEYTGGTAYVDTGQALPTGYTCATFPHDTDPATGSAYTVAGVNAAEFGYELTA